MADLRAALGARLQRLDWMSAQTKQKALEKLGKLNVKVGYPNKWRDYSKLTLSADDLYGNVERAEAADWAFRVGRLNKPVDRDEWDMTPQTVNAYYDATKNEIDFPAAILQPPFFDPAADPAVNYGAIGQVIGHEMTHGFDDQGRKSDGDGVLARLVDGRGRQAIHPARGPAGRPVFGVRTFSGRARQRQADPGREYRRPGRAAHRAGRLPCAGSGASPRRLSTG